LGSIIGLPLTNTFVDYILTNLGCDEETNAEIKCSDLPFEAFVEILSRNTDITKVLEMFKIGQPNTNHLLIAKLAKNGYIRTICTTNFDLLIEQALESENIKYSKYYNENGFEDFCPNNPGNEIRLFKIHGSADGGMESIRTTLSLIANRTLSGKRTRVVDHLFSTGQHDTVLILGYSCSDVFDITPMIQNLKSKKKNIVYIEHSNVCESEDIKSKNKNNPFKNYSGACVKCNTDLFIKMLWDSFQDTIGSHKYLRFTSEWKQYADNWIGEAKDYDGYKSYLIGVLLENISSFSKSVRYLNKALESLDCKGFSDLVRCHLIGCCYMAMGNAFYGLGNYKQAIKYHEAYLDICKNIGDKKGEGKCYIALGNVYSNLGNFTDAVKYQEKGLGVFTILKYDQGKLLCYANLGSAYAKLGNFKKSLMYLGQSIKLCKDLGDKRTEATSLLNVGAIYATQRIFNKAIKLIMQSLQINSELGNAAGEADCYTNMGLIYERLEKSREAITYHLRALVINEKNCCIAGEATCYVHLAHAYHNLGDSRKAIDYLKKALHLYVKLSDLAAQAKCFEDLSAAYYGGLGDMTQTSQCLTKALNIYTEAGDDLNMANCYMKLGFLYKLQENFTQSIEYVLRAEQIYERMGRDQCLESVYDYLFHLYQKTGNCTAAENYYRKLNQHR